MKKVLLITNDFPPMGGGEAALYARICATVPDRALVLAPSLPGDQTFDASVAYRVFRRRVSVSHSPAARLVQIVLFCIHGIWIVRQARPSGVHLGHLYLGLVGLVLKRLLGIPYVLYLHGGEMAPYMRYAAVRAVVRMVVRSAARVVVNSDYTRRHFEALGLSHPRVELLTMSVPTGQFRPDLDRAAARAKYGLNGTRVILTVGRLVERKGHDMVLHALGDIREAVGPVRYLIAGRGPEEARLRALARELGRGDDVLFLGHVPDEELPLLYAASDVVVMPSRALADRDGIEGFGITFLEAAASGKPVVGGASGGVAEAVVDGVTGVLVPPTDVDAVAAAIIRLLRNPAEAAAMGASGRRRAEALEAAWAETVERIWGPIEAGA